MTLSITPLVWGGKCWEGGYCPGGGGCWDTENQFLFINLERHKQCLRAPNEEKKCFHQMEKKSPMGKKQFLGEFLGGTPTLFPPCGREYRRGWLTATSRPLPLRITKKILFDIVGCILHGRPYNLL